MTGPTHLTFAAASSLALIVNFNPVFKWYYIIVICIGALAPDLDAQRSSIHKPSSLLQYMLPGPIIRTVDLFARFFAAMVRTMVSHRGVLHSPLVAFGLLCAAYPLNSSILFWFSFAYLGHILLDFCTAGGIPFFSPFSKKSYSASGIKTGSYFETIFCAMLLWYIVFTFYSLVELNPEEIRVQISSYFDKFSLN